MKTVGKQLQEARLAKDWTPELAARETKIKVDRLRDLEADDYSHFTSPTYARGFVRTYARALGLDEYRILRQLDNKLPDDDSANIVTDNSGVAYLPETAMPPRVAHRDFTGLYIVMGLGAVVTLAIVFVLFEAYRVGELQRYFNNGQEAVVASGTNAAPANPTADTDNRAKPIDSNTPPPVAEVAPVTNAPAADATTNAVAAVATNAPTEVAAVTNAPGPVAPRALPVDPSVLGSNGDTNAAPVVVAPRALPVDLSVPVTPAPTQATSLAPPTDPAPDATVPVKVAPRALPVNPSDLAAATAVSMPATNSSSVLAMNTVPPVPAPPVNALPAAAMPTIHSSSSARQSNSGPVLEPSMPPVGPTAETAPAAVIPTAVPVAPVDVASQAPAPTSATAATDTDKRLVLTASQDSFVRVTKLDGADADKPLYASVLHSGQSVGFDGRKFSINVGVPSAVDIKLDGVNYGPHSDQDAPETFTVQSHLP